MYIYVFRFVSSIALNDSSVSSLESAIIRPSLNPPLLFAIHSLLWSHRDQLIRQLGLSSAHSNFCSRLTAILDDIGSPNRPIDCVDEMRTGDTRVTSVFYSIVHTPMPAYVLIWRRFRYYCIKFC